MRFEIKYTWDSRLAFQRIKCLFAHDWERHQYCVTADRNDDRPTTLVVAFKICKRCAKSKLIHILV